MLLNTAEETLQLVMLLETYGEIDFPVLHVTDSKNVTPEHRWKLVKDKMDSQYSPNELSALAERISPSFITTTWKDFDDTTTCQYICGYYV